MKVKQWQDQRVKQEEIDKYLKEGKDFIPHQEINQLLSANEVPDKKQISDILQKSLSIKTLTPKETALLLKVTDPDLLAQMQATALQVKKKVYDNRIVTFAPLYMGNKCINNCLYCGFRIDNPDSKRRVLTMEEIEREVKVLAGKIGHKRLIIVYGEHPETNVDYIVQSMKTIYSVKEKTKKGYGQIRRLNVNAAPMQIQELKKLKEASIGTYQVFQETYHLPTYHHIHPETTVKGNYLWRLYAMHRAFEAGIDDVGLGVLFGLYKWQFELLSLVYHSRELESTFGVGPHTISFPRLESALNAPYIDNKQYSVNDEDFKKIVTIIRLSVPHTGMILTARENEEMRRQIIPLGCTQTDASTKIGLGAYSEEENLQDSKRQQFIIGDMRSLDTVVKELAQMGYITSFCTAGYRCGRTGECIMENLKSGKEGVFCKLNAILTFREWLDDFASAETKIVGEKLIKKEIADVKNKIPEIYTKLMSYYERVLTGERDLYF